MLLKVYLYKLLLVDLLEHFRLPFFRNSEFITKEEYESFWTGFHFSFCYESLQVPYTLLMRILFGPLLSTLKKCNLYYFLFNLTNSLLSNYTFIFFNIRIERKKKILLLNNEYNLINLFLFLHYFFKWWFN